MTYYFNIKNFGMHGHLFKMTNIDLTEEIEKIRKNPEMVRDVHKVEVDYDSLVIVIEYCNKKTEAYFFKSIGFGLKKYSEIRKAIGIRI